MNAGIGQLLAIRHPELFVRLEIIREAIRQDGYKGNIHSYFSIEVAELDLFALEVGLDLVGDVHGVDSRIFYRAAVEGNDTL